MDWAIIFSMPLMLLLGFLGDALSRDEDEEQEMGQANPGDAALAGIEPGGDVTTAGDGLSAMMAASEPAVPIGVEPVGAIGEDAPEEVAAAAVQMPEDAPAAVDTAATKAEAEDKAAADEDPAAEDPAAEDPAAEDPAAEGPAGDGAAEQPGEEPAKEGDVAEVEDFDPAEDVLLVEAPGAAGQVPDFEQTEEGTFVRLAGQETFLRGVVSDLPADAVVGVEPSPSG